MKLTSKLGFTLAEVLITLGIIGVVAAMTMPTLMNQTNGAQFKTAYKKALSAISQAVTLNVALEEWNFADATATSTGADDQSVYSLLNKRMNVVRKETGAITGYTISGATAPAANSNYTLFFNDGIMFTFDSGSKECTRDETKSTTDKACKGFIDVNGIKPPNKAVKCDTGADDTNCVVKSPTDIYPVLFFDQTIIPNSPAARSVLYSK